MFQHEPMDIFIAGEGRPVPGWRQSKESVTLENRGYHFEEAEFEAHFRDQGREN